MELANTYGEGVLSARPGGFVLTRGTNGRCIFLLDRGGLRACGLQGSMKPIACKLWPFKVYFKPKYGRDEEAVFTVEEGRFFVYVDLGCKGVKLGTPTPGLVETISEVVRIALNPRRTHQVRTTSLLFPPASISQAEAIASSKNLSGLRARVSEWREYPRIIECL